MSTQHTPGPWTFYDDSNDGKTNRIEIVAIGKTVARIYHSVPEDDLPNARLIAAAPDMLEALYNALPYLDDVLANKDQLACFKPGVVQAHAKAIRAAIAKATGEQA